MLDLIFVALSRAFVFYLLWLLSLWANYVQTNFFSTKLYGIRYYKSSCEIEKLEFRWLCQLITKLCSFSSSLSFSAKLTILKIISYILWCIKFDMSIDYPVHFESRQIRNLKLIEFWSVSFKKRIQFAYMPWIKWSFIVMHFQVEAGQIFCSNF